MKVEQGALIASVAGVVAAAVVIGGAFAYWQGPSDGAVDAAALPAVSETPSPTPSAPTPTPAPTPTLKPSAPKPSTRASTPPSSTPSFTGPVKVALTIGKLPTGRAPQLPYLVGREVRGGDGWAVKIPGADTIHQVARMGDDVLAVVSDAGRWRLARVGQSGKATYVAEVSSLAAVEGGSVAYAAVRSDGAGGTVYSATTGSVRKLAVPATARGLEVLAVGTDGKVYYHWQDAEAAPWKLFEWVPGAATARQLRTAASPDRVSNDGTLAISTSNSAPGEASRICSTVTALTTGTQLWRTCDSVLEGFTPGHSVAIGVGGRGDIGTATSITAQETATGKVIREWTGTFETVVPEDDQHVLILAQEANGNSRRAIIRCDLSTGGCELATPLASTTQSPVYLLGAP